MKLEQLHIAVDRAIQLQSADQLVDRPDTTIADRPCLFRNHISDIGVLKHRLRLVVKVFSLKSFLEISLVSLQKFCGFFCSPGMCSFDCSSYMQVPITTNNDAHSRYVSPFLEKNYAGFGPSFWPETSPEGANQESPGRKPWEQAKQQRKPRRGDAVVPLLK